MNDYLGHRPKLYDSDETEFVSNGYGYLSEGITCKIIEELNTSFELRMEYPCNGILFNEIKVNRIITAQPQPNASTRQPFRIYRITKPINGVATIYAAHISYELSGIICDEPYLEYAEDEGGVGTVISFMNSVAERFATEFSSFEFRFYADGEFEKRTTWSIPSPTDLKTIMQNVVTWFGGQWEFDGTKCILHERRGEDRGTAVQYGQNLIDISEDADNSNIYTHVMPYFVKEDNTLIGGLDNCVSTGTEINGYFKVLPLDLTREFNEEPTISELNEKARDYIAENSIGNIVISRNVSFVNRGQTVEHRFVGDFDRVNIGDTVMIKVPPLGISVSAICTKTVYDCLYSRYDSVEIGDLKKDIVKTIAELSKQEKNYPKLFVKDVEPSKEDKPKVGDYWIKIDDEVNRNAQSLGKYKGGLWNLLCEFATGGGDRMPRIFVQAEEPEQDEHTLITYGDFWIETYDDVEYNAKALYKYVQDPEDEDSGLWDKLCDIRSGGVGENVGQHNERFNDYSNNRVLNGDYNHVEGYKNVIESGNYSHLGGHDNTLSTSGVYVTNCSQIFGDNNSLSGSYNVVFGDRNNVSGSYSIINGSNNTLSYANKSIIITSSSQISRAEASLILGDTTPLTAAYSVVVGTSYSSGSSGRAFGSIVSGANQNIKANIDCSGIFGSSNDITHELRYSVLAGMDNVIDALVSECIIGGDENKIYHGQSNLVVGSGNTIGSDAEYSSASYSIVGGVYNTVTGVSSLAVGLENTVRANQSIVCGIDNTATSDCQIVCGNGNDPTPHSNNYFEVGGGGSGVDRTVFAVDNLGNARGTAFITSGADYAEYFEWADGNPENEDRRGMLVSLDGDKIVPANSDDIFGIISANPSVIGNSASLEWNGKYKRDIFGALVYDDEGHPVVSEDYDKEQKYIPRSERPEWAAVGLVGRLIVVDNGTCQPNKYCKAENGRAVLSETKTNVRTLRRIDETHIEIFIK